MGEMAAVEYHAASRNSLQQSLFPPLSSSLPLSVMSFAINVHGPVGRTVLSCEVMVGLSSQGDVAGLR